VHNFLNISIFWNILAYPGYAIFRTQLIVASVVTNLDNAMVDDKNENGETENTNVTDIGIASTLADDLDDDEKAEIFKDMQSRDAKLTFMTNHSAFIKLRQRPLFKCSSESFKNPRNKKSKTFCVKNPKRFG